MNSKKLVSITLMIVLIQIAITSIITVQAQTTPTITTDKADYAPGEIVTISGAGFVAGNYYDIPVIRPDGSIVILNEAGEFCSRFWNSSSKHKW